MLNLKEPSSLMIIKFNYVIELDYATAIWLVGAHTIVSLGLID